MWASGQELDAEARKAAKDAVDATKRMRLNPAALAKRLAAKKKKQREAKANGDA